ncbi:hypothetical protein BGZ74_008516 [Mortierella antarctica]|nr:hypothetical protein BGZ74_008516 [Mortierella antarctica]
MPRQDYSLPTVLPLPWLAPAKPKPKSTSAETTAPVNTAAVPQPQSQEPESTSVPSTSTIADDYDMLDDDDLFDIESLLADIETLDIKGFGDATMPLAESDTRASGSAAKPTFVDMLLKGAEPVPEKADPNMTYTENMAPTLKSSGDVRLDFFFEVLKGTDPSTVKRLVRDSWEQNPLDTLRLIFQLRSVLHGKGERKEFYTCMDFLRQEHPRTLLYNLRFVPNHGYWKDLLNWLVFECRDDLADDQYTLTSRPKLRKSSGKYKNRKALITRPVHKRPRLQPAPPPKKAKKDTEESGESDKDAMEEDKPEKLAKSKAELTPEEKEEVRKKAIAKAEEFNHQKSMEARERRLALAVERIDKARKRFVENKFYRALHIEVARLFANALAWDKARLAKGQSISLAAKWCPSLSQFHDNHTLIATTIAQILFPDKLSNEDQATYVNRIREKYRQEYYVPLRKATPVLETLMAAQQWSEIMYNRVPSVAMKNLKEVFEDHDKERFSEFLNKVSKGETTIAAKALMPHQLVHESQTLHGVDREDLCVKTMDAQWNAYVDKLAEEGKMKSCLAICDVSGSMSGEPMEVAVALSLLLAQLSQPPFDKVILTFSAEPQIYRVEESSLIDKVSGAYRMKWGMNTDLAKAFDKILSLAVESKLPKEDMVQTLFIFSDMEFDEAICGGHSLLGDHPREMFTNYNVAKRKFDAAGYELPQIVFWNLRGSIKGNKPAGATQPGVALVSGFSGMLMKLFLSGEDITKVVDPVQIMEKAIHAKEFAKLKVID